MDKFRRISGTGCRAFRGRTKVSKKENHKNRQRTQLKNQKQEEEANMTVDGNAEMSRELANLELTEHMILENALLISP
jgi:mevalonate pyrophosphate decarboxylase